MRTEANRAAGPPRAPPSATRGGRHVRLGHHDEGRQVHQDLQDRPAENGICGRWRAPSRRRPGIPAPRDPGPATRGGQHLRLEARVHLAPEGHQHGPSRSTRLHSEADRPRELNPAKSFQEDVELRVRGPRAGSPPIAVVDAVHDVHREPQDQVHRVPGLDHAQEGRRGNRRHQRAGESLAREGRVGDGRPVRVLSLGAQGHAAVRYPGTTPLVLKMPPRPRTCSEPCSR